MKIPFRQGIVSCTFVGTVPTFLLQSSTANFIDFNVSPDPTVVAFAHGMSDYVQVFDRDVNRAWGPITGTTNNYLYWEIDLITAQVNYKITLLTPAFAPLAPISPSYDQHWFDLTTNTMRYWNGTKWVPKVAVFAGIVVGGSSANIQEYALGTQVELNVSTDAGYIMLNSQLQPIYANPTTWEFLTTGSPVHILTTSGTSGILAVPPNSFIPVRAGMSIPAFSLVYFSSPDTISLASGNPSLPTPRTPIGVIQEELSLGEIGVLTQAGEIYWDQWDWSEHIGKALYCGNNGEITTIRPSSLQAYRVAMVKNAKTIIFQVDAETNPQVYNATVNDVIVNGLPPISTSYATSPTNERIWTVEIAPASPTASGYMSAAQVTQLDGYGTRISTAEANILDRALLSHTQAISTVIGLQDALNTKWNLGDYVATDIRYAAIGHTHPTLYAPLVHSHFISDITGLQSAINLKADLTTVISLLENKANLIHTHVIDNITGLQLALDTKLSKDGDTMTGQLILNGNPVVALGAATKQYVDSVVSSASVSLTNKHVAFGSSSNLVASSANFTWDDSVSKLSLGTAGSAATIGMLDISSAGTGATFAMYGQNNTSTGAAGNIQISGGFAAGATVTAIGGALTLSSGAGAKGGDVNISTGQGALGSGNITIASGASNGGASGTVTLTAGIVYPGHTPGIVTVRGADSITTFNTPGGGVIVRGGHSGQTANTSNGGSLTLAGGNAYAAGVAGNISIDGGLMVSPTTGVGGDVLIRTGFTSLTERLRIRSAGDWLLAGLAGTAGQFLTSNGTNAAPTWTSLSTDIAYKGQASVISSTWQFLQSVLVGPPTTNGHAATKIYVDTADLLKVNLTGGTMTGALTLNGAPTIALHAATKQYVDDNIFVIGSINQHTDVDTVTNLPVTDQVLTWNGTQWVPQTVVTATVVIGSIDQHTDVDTVTNLPVTDQVLTWNGTLWVPQDVPTPTGFVLQSGDTMSGLLLLSGDPAVDLGAATKQYVDTRVDRSGDTMTGSLVLASDPVADLGAATKQYVDNNTFVIGSINQHTDVDTVTNSPAINEVLTWNGTNWVPETPALGIVASTPIKPAPLSINSSAATSLDFGSAKDHNTSYRMTSATAVTVTIENDSYWTGTDSYFANDYDPVDPGPMPQGGNAVFGKHGAGNITFIAAAGVTLNYPDTLNVSKLNAKVTLIKVGPNEWDLEGHFDTV